jgi:hypothetical protein
VHRLLLTHSRLSSLLVSSRYLAAATQGAETPTFLASADEIEDIHDSTTQGRLCLPKAFNPPVCACNGVLRDCDNWWPGLADGLILRRLFCFSVSLNRVFVSLSFHQTL